MSKVQWRPERNVLTTPHSYRARVVAKNSIGYAGLSARIAAKNPLWSADMVQSVLRAAREEIKQILLEGDQVTLEEAFTFHLTISARLNTPDSPLPQNKNIVNVQIYASRALMEEVRQDVRLERLPMVDKVPVINSTQDTLLKLADVLNPSGLLRLNGEGLLFNPEKGTGECVIEGTRDGRAVQSRLGEITNTKIMLVPDIPSQTAPWNNEYLLSVSVRYSEQGSLRTGTYRLPLRTPLTVRLASGDGMLSGSSDIPLVTTGAGTLAANSAQVRIQAAVDAQDGILRLNLLDMKEGGAAGDAVAVTGNGDCTLPGYAGSDLRDLTVTVDDYAALLQLVRQSYGNRLVDVLDVTQGT